MGVVALHAPSGWATDYVRLIASVAVPIFYLITGYFLYTEDRAHLQERLSKSIQKVLFIILITHTVYTLIDWRSIPSLEQYMLWFKWLILGQHFSGGHLWYLTALLQALLLLWLINRLGYSKYLPGLITCLAFKVVFEDYREILFGTSPSMLAANALFYSIPWVATGFTIHKCQSKLLQYKGWLYVMLISIIVAYLVRFTLEGTAQVLLTPWARFTMILSIFLFTLKNTEVGKGSPLAYIGKELSGNIYYWHDLMIRLSWAWLPSYIFASWGSSSVAILSLALAFVVVWIQGRLKINYLP